MKKILNDPYQYVDEMLDGLTAAHPEFYERAGDGMVIKRPDAPIGGKVGVISGGGSGHLPVFTGYVGPGLPRRVCHRRRLRVTFARSDNRRYWRGERWRRSPARVRQLWR